VARGVAVGYDRGPGVSPQRYGDLMIFARNSGRRQP